MSYEPYGDTGYGKWTPQAAKDHPKDISWDEIDDMWRRTEDLLRESALEIMGPHTD